MRAFRRGGGNFATLQHSSDCRPLSRWERGVLTAVSQSPHFVAALLQLIAQGEHSAESGPSSAADFRRTPASAAERASAAGRPERSPRRGRQGPSCSRRNRRFRPVPAPRGGGCAVARIASAVIQRKSWRCGSCSRLAVLSWTLVLPVSGFTSRRIIRASSLLPPAKVTSDRPAGQNTPSPLTSTTPSRIATKQSVAASAAAVAQTQGSPRRQKRLLALGKAVGTGRHCSIGRLPICTFKLFIARCRHDQFAFDQSASRLHLRPPLANAVQATSKPAEPFSAAAAGPIPPRCSP